MFVIAVMSYQSVYVIILYFASTILTNINKLYFPKKYLLGLSVILIYGLLLSLFNILTDSYIYSYSTSVLLRGRFYLLQLIFAVSIAISMYKKPIEINLKIIYYSAILNMIVGILQLLATQFDRINMLTPEPSSAAFNYVFIVPLLLEYLKYNSTAKVWVYVYIIVGLLIKSKVFVVVFPIWMIIYIVLKYGISRKIFLRVVLVVLVVLFLLPQIMPVDKMLYFFNILQTEGVYGLNESNAIWTSFTMRASGFMTALLIIFSNPLGVGFGSFHPIYIQTMLSHPLLSYIEGIEIRSVFDNLAYATPKSSFLELTVSAGIVFIAFISWVLKDTFKNRIPIHFRISGINIILASFISELTPLLVVVTIYYIIINTSETQIILDRKI